MEKPTNDQWKEIMKSITSNEGVKVEIPNNFGKYFYDNFLNCLPPIIYSSTYVLCSEPYSHTNKGEGVYIGIFFKNKQWYGITCTVSEFKKQI